MTFLPAHIPGFKSYVTVCALSGLLAAPALSLAESVSTSEWNISADKITRYEDPQSIVAEGNIILEKRVQMPPKQDTKKKEEVTGWDELLGLETAKTVEEETGITAEEVAEQIENAEKVYKTAFHIEADWLTYDVDLREIKARGNVKIVSEDDTLLADQGKLDLNTETGSFTDAVIIRKEDDLHLEGEVIEKTGFNTYHIENGWAITCKIKGDEAPPWSFASSDTKIKEGGYAVMKNATFNIKGVPVFYTPYMVIPVKDTRQTGFVFPEFSYSEYSEFGINVPFFWNISDSMDLTFFPEYYTGRGFKPGVEFRYVMTENNKASFLATYLDDDLSNSDAEGDYYDDTGYTHTNTDRYWITGKADHIFKNEVQVRLDVDIVSDKDYLSEFRSGYTGYNDTDDRYLDIFGRSLENRTDYARTNTLKFLKSWSGQSLEVNMLAINDVEDEDADSEELWKLPSVDYTGVLEIGETGISLDWEADYVNYWREEGTGGHRVDIHPTISSSIPLTSYLESRAQLGVRDTFYMIDTFGDTEWDYDDSQNRLLADFEMEVATTLLKNFDRNNDGQDDFDHQVRPYVLYNYIPNVDQDELPDFDSVDEIDEANKITYGIDNYFYVTGKDDSSYEWAYAKIYQSYDLRSSESDEPFSDITLKLSFTPVNRITLEYDTDFDPYDDGFTSHSLEGNYTNSRGDYFALDYSFDDDSDIEQINAYVRAKLIDSWSLKLEVEHSIASDETNEADFALKYQALCWSVEFQSNYTPDETEFMLVFNLANIGTPLGLSY